MIELGAQSMIVWSLTSTRLPEPSTHAMEAQVTQNDTIMELFSYTEECIR